MDPFTTAFGPIFTAVAGAVLAWLLLRGRDSAAARKPELDPAAKRERFYRRSFETSPVGLAVMSPHGKWLRFNERFRAMLGYTRDELNGRTLRELTHSDDRKVEATHHRKLVAREISSYALEKRLRCRDGEYRRFDVSILRFEDESGGDLWQCVANPLANGAPDEAVESAGGFEAALGAADDLACIRCDDQGIIREWNRGAVRIFGHEREDILGRSRTMLYRESDVYEQKPLSDLKAALDAGRLEGDDVRVGSDGMEIRLRITIVPEIVGGRAVGFAEIARDIEQVRGVDQYRQAYERLKSLSDERIQALHDEVGSLRAERDSTSEREATIKNEMERIRLEAKKQLAELRILTDAFRKELDRRKTLEQELTAALAEREALGHRMQEMEKRRPLVESEVVEIATPGEVHWMPIEGLRLVDVFRDLASEKKTGALVASARGVEKRIFFEDGLVYSSTSSDPSMLLGEILLRDGSISRHDHQRALEVHNETGIAMGRILVLSGVLDETSLESAMQRKTKRDVLDLLAWSEGEIMFLEGEPRPLQLVPVRMEVEPLVLEDLVAREVSEDVTLTSVPKTTLTVPEPVAEPAPEPAPSPPSFVASRAKRSTKFHRVECRQANRIDRAKRIEFRTEDEALARGLERCAKCFG